MKKKLIVTSVIAVLACGAAFAQSTSVVSSVNVVGYNQITIPSNKLVLVSVGFDRGTNNTLASMFGHLPNGTKISIWETVPVQGWKTYQRGLTGFTAAVGTNRIAVGSGCFVQLPANVQTNIYFSGDVPTNETYALNRTNGYTMLSYPYPVDVAITNTAIGKSAVNGNKISVWRNNGYTTYQRGLTGWGAPGSNVLTVGSAYIFYGTTSYATNEFKPYTLN